MDRDDSVDSQVPVSTRAPVVEPGLSGGRLMDVLVVDSSLELWRIARRVLRTVATVHGSLTFEDARRRLISSPPDLLVTSFRLDGHNGVHLVYLAARDRRTRCIVHLTAEDVAVTFDAEAAGALVVREPGLEAALQSLVLGHTAPRRSQTA